MARSKKRRTPPDLTAGMVYDRAAFTWVTPEEMARRDAIREDRMLEQSLNQGQLAAPMIISDSLGTHGVQSMLDGRYYDSKSNLRRTYRDAGVTEVGNDSSLKLENIRSSRVPHKRPKTQHEKDLRRAQIRHDVEHAFSQVNLTSYRRDEI